MKLILKIIKSKSNNLLTVLLLLFFTISMSVNASNTITILPHKGVSKIVKICNCQSNELVRTVSLNTYSSLDEFHSTIYELFPTININKKPTSNISSNTSYWTYSNPDNLTSYFNNRLLL